MLRAASLPPSPTAMLQALAPPLLLLLLLASPAAHAIEEPDFVVLQQSEAFELRQVAPYMVAEVVHPGPREQADGDSFRLLFRYISGANRGERKIEMTAPVTTTAAAGGYVTAFVLPRQFGPDNAPQPTDPRVTLRAVPAELLAVRRFSGRWTDARFGEELQRLRSAVAEAGLKVKGEPVLSRFDPPMMPPFLRRNEIWLRVEK